MRVEAVEGLFELVGLNPFLNDKHNAGFEPELAIEHEPRYLMGHLPDLFYRLVIDVPVSPLTLIACMQYKEV
jgi:hypothetical protein